jgi:hypothetical protein
VYVQETTHKTVLEESIEKLAEKDDQVVSLQDKVRHYKSEIGRGSLILL